MLDVNGLILESQFPELQFIVKGPLITEFRDGFPIQRPKHIVLQFDRYVCELDLMAREQEWTDEDKVSVGRTMEQYLSDPMKRDVWIHRPPKVPMPWPTYDDTHHNQIPIIAQSVGLVLEALRYEEHGREGGPRESVVQKLNALLQDQPIAESVDEDQLTAV